MSYSRRSRYSRSPSPDKRYSRSISRSLSRSRSVSGSRSRSPSRDVENPGNNLYVTGLSPRITKRELEKHFASEGKVIDVHLVVDPWTRESRGFGFVTMETVEEADHCVKYLNRSVLEGRVITVEKARRRRGRTPTPGRYLGLRTIRVRRRSSSYSPRRSPSYSPYRRSFGRSPCYSSDRSRSRSYSPYYRRRRSCSPYYSRRRSYSRSRSPYGRSLDDQYYRGRDRSYSPSYRRQRSYSPYDSRYDLLDDRYYRRYRHRSVSRSLTPPRGRRSYSRSPTPKRRRSRRSYSRSMSPRARRSYSRSVSCTPKKSVSHGGSSKYRNSRDSYSVSYSGSRSSSRSSRSVSRSVSPSSGSPSA